MDREYNRYGNYIVVYKGTRKRGKLMKKKLIAFMFATVLAVSVTACGNSEKDSTPAENESVQEETEEKAELEEQETKEEPVAEPAATTLADLETYLLEKGVLSGEKTETAASMIGAVSGFKYADSNAEFYEYDENSEAYKTLSSGGSVEIEGMSGYSVSATAINGKYVLIASADISQDLIDAFNSFK